MNVDRVAFAAVRDHAERLEIEVEALRKENRQLRQFQDVIYRATRGGPSLYESREPQADCDEKMPDTPAEHDRAMRD